MKPRSIIRWQHRLKREHPTCTERKQNRSLRLRMEGWRQWQLGGRKTLSNGRNLLDSDRASHGRRSHSLENSLLNLHSVFGDSKVYGCDCDFVPEFAKRSRQHPGAFVLGLGIRFAALLDKSHPLMQDLPNHTAEPMGDGPDGRLIAQPRQQT